jgi:DNA-binding NarL/FixJ family response regulator
VGDTLIRPRILLADDHLAMLEAEIALLSPYFDVVGTAADGHNDVRTEAMGFISMPGLNGIDAVHKLRESGSRVKFVFLTIHSGKEFVDGCMGAGAFGYVQKRDMKHQLVPAIHAALAGRFYVSQRDPTK